MYIKLLIVTAYSPLIDPALYTLQEKSHLYIPFLGITRSQSQYPHLYVCERFIFSQDLSTYISLQQNRQTNPGNI